MTESYGQASKYPGQSEIARLEQLRNSLGQLADNLAGTRPAPASTDIPESPPHSLVDRLQRLRRRMDAVLTTCEHERDRIGQALS